MNSPPSTPAKPPLNPLRTLWQKHPNKTLALVSATIFAVISFFLLRDQPGVQMRLDLTRLIEAPLELKMHFTAAVSAFLIGVVLLIGAKGNLVHRALGYGWVIAMAVTAISSFFLFGGITNHISVIHGLSAWTLIGLPMGVALARRHKVAAHGRQMTGMFTGGMAIAGLFTFLPGRLMWSLFFGIQS